MNSSEADVRSVPIRHFHTNLHGTGPAKIDILPDEVLLDIFHFCRVDGINTFGVTWEWETLVHVCRRWRHLIFATPRGLDLRLVCTRRTPGQGMLNIWPDIPIIIFDQNELTSDLPIPNIIAALECHDRVYGIWLNNLTYSQWELFTAATQTQFSALTFLELGPRIKTDSVLPVEFLGGSAPNLRIVRLVGIPFPAIPHLLLSSRDLVDLQLRDVPIEGYVSPMAIVAGLSALSNLRKLSIGFRSPKSPTDRTIRFPRPRKRVVLPALTDLGFRGVSEYLEDFVERIDAPLLLHFEISFFNQLIFHLPKLARFITRTEKLKSFDQADVALRVSDIRFSLLSPGREVYIALEISCGEIDWQLSSLVQVCDQLHSLASRVEWLDLAEKRVLQRNWQDDMDHTQWLELFQTFPALNTLRLAKGVGSLVSRALQGLSTDSATEVLPALRYLSLATSDEQFLSIQEAIMPFLSARHQHPDRTVVVRRWER